MEIITLVLFISTFIFVSLSVVFIVLYVKRGSDMVKPENCPKITGDYGVISNTNPNNLRPIYQCTASPNGTTGTSICTFTGINDLYSAINICESYANSICKGFYYDQNGKIMTILDISYDIKSDTTESSLNGNVFIQQK
jgi:hypothetical protein